MSRRLNALIVLTVVAVCLSLAVFVSSRNATPASQVTACRAGYYAQVVLADINDRVAEALGASRTATLAELERTGNAYRTAVQLSKTNPDQFLKGC